MTQTSERPLKILCLTSHSPEGQEQGARLRARHVLRQLSRFAEVRLVLAGSHEKYIEAPAPLPNPSRPSEIFDFHPWEVQGLGERLRQEFGSTYLNTHGFKATEKDRGRLIEMLEEHDLVWVHGLHVANGFNLWKWPKTILDIDDIPSEMFKTVLSHAQGPEAKLRALRRVWLWKRHEARLFERFDAMAVCSHPDRAYFGNSDRVFVIHNGFEVPAETLARMPSTPPRIGFIGSFAYQPNAQGMRWFLRDVWPNILKSAPNTVLRLVGRNSQLPEWVNAPNVEGLGWVADADAEMATWSLTVVPVFEGGGTRVKISNAFSRKCPVVSTQLGAYGYEVANDRELLFADAAPDFAAACLRILENPTLALRLANTAWDSFLANWTWDANAPRLQQAIRFVLGQNGNSITP